MSPPIADRALRRVLAFVVALCIWALASSAHAGDKALAESLFETGRQLMQEGKYAEACDKFEESNAQDPSPGALINLAACQEKLGKTASAWASYREAATMARLRGRSEQEQHAQEAADRLGPTLSKLRIDPPPERPPELKLLRGSVELSAGSLGTAVPVDPGEYVIEASAPGYAPWKQTIKIGPNGDSKVVTVPPLEKLAETATEPPATSSSTVSGSTDVRRDTSGAATKTIGYVLIGVGGAALIAGGIFGYLAQQQASDAEDDPTLCPAKKCSQAGREEIDGAYSKALISTVGVGVGVAAIGTGIVLLVTSGPSASTAHAAGAPRALPFLGPNSGGLSLSGRF